MPIENLTSKRLWGRDELGRFHRHLGPHKCHRHNEAPNKFPWSKILSSKDFFLIIISQNGNQ